MERNWLIRTSQNQILGPVAKQKLLEFVQKGSLGLLDEISSGNGYWFYLNEADLVEKYVYGDLPQGYNPISESRSVLSKLENPNKTTSINSSPANQINLNTYTSSTQIIKLDLDALNTSKKSSNIVIQVTEPTKLPNQDDLEFPDVNLIASSVNASFENGDLALKSSLTSIKIPMPIPKPTVASTTEPEIFAEDMILPDDDDLAFPEMDDIKTSIKIEKGKVDLSHQYTRTVALDIRQAATVLPIEIVKEDLEEELEEELEENLSFEAPKVNKTITPEEIVVVENSAQIQKSNVPTPSIRVDRTNNKNTSTEDKKLLHDRPTKSHMNKGAALRDPSRENLSKEVQAVPQKRNDTYLFFILIILVLIIFAIFFYFTEILNKPLPM